MKKVLLKKSFSSENGFTGADIAVAIMIFVIFAGVISSLLYSIYANSISIEKSAYASAYATIILEKVDEKSYNEITNDFMELIQNEIDYDSSYDITLNTTELYYNKVKQVELILKYDVQNEERIIKINKLKIKE